MQRPIVQLHARSLIGHATNYFALRRALKRNDRIQATSEAYCSGPIKKPPQLAWIKCDEQPGDDYSPAFDIPDLIEIMGLPFRKLARTTFWKNFVRGRELECLFEVWMRDNFLNDGSFRNQSAATATKGNMAHDWRGPLVVLKYNGLEERSRYADMGLQDFRDAVDYLTYYTNEDAWSKYWTGGYP